MVNVLILKVSKLAMYTLIMQSSPRSFRTKRGLRRTPSHCIVEEARRGGENRLTPPPEKRGKEVYGRREKRGREVELQRWREAVAALCNISQSKKMQRGGSQQLQGRNRD